MSTAMVFRSACLAVFVIAGAITAELATAQTLDRIKDRGILSCGVVNSGVGLSEIDETGQWQGFFPEFCRFLAAAVLGDANAVEYFEVNYVVRFDALLSGAVDVLMANTTWTTGRDAELDLAFTHPLYYDGQGFLAHRSLGASALQEVETAPVCVGLGTTTIRNLQELIERDYTGLEILAFQSSESVSESFFSRDCDILTQDRVALVSQRLSRASDSNQYVLFPDVISKEPLGPVVREGDQEWLDIVQWAGYASLIAEEHSITSETADTF